MKRKNLFDGEAKAHYARVVYRWLMSRKRFSYTDIVTEEEGLDSEDQLPYSISVYKNDKSDKRCWGELWKALPEVVGEIRARLGHDSVEDNSNNRGKWFRYVGPDSDPLADMLKAKVINNINQYWDFCQDSAGFFPKVWLDYYFKDCQDLLDIKSKRQKGKLVISTSVDRILTNIEYLPSLFEAIKNRIVLEIDYKPFDKKQETHIFHPHYLKECNGRWHLFGHSEGREPEFGYDLAIDRFQSKPREKYRIKYIGSPKFFYENRFKDIVGVSREEGAKLHTVVIRAHSYYVYKLMETKPFHPTYKLIKPFDEYEDGKYAEFSFDVEPNKEFVGRILQMGSALEVISPIEEMRKRVKNEITAMLERYK